MRRDLTRKSMHFLMISTVLLIAVSSVSATDINREDVIVDIADSSVEAEIEVGELTSSVFTYITTKQKVDVNGSINGENIECRTREVAIGSEIRCDTELRENFTVNLEYTASDGFVEDRRTQKVFRYQHPVYRSTESYNLEVLLPEGTALMQDDNTSQVISPLNAETSTNGRQISVKWNTNPDLGETLTFYLLYEDFTPPNPNEEEEQDYTDLIIILLGLGVIGGLAAVVKMYLRRENLSEVAENLSDEEMEVIELLKENEGEFLQKNVVDELDYSKAKISGLVSGLVEKEVVEKTKEGRSNKLVIPKKYSY